MKTDVPVGIGFRNPDRAIVLLGGLGGCDLTHFGGTEYASVIIKQQWGLPPALDMDYEKYVQAAVRQVVREGLAESSHDLSDGGLAVALAECSFPNGIGASVDLDSDLRAEFLLFHEGPSRILVSTSDPDAVLRIAATNNVEAIVIGSTVAGRLDIARRGEKLAGCEVAALKASWEGALPKLLHG
jgi:phosphoribosylformylglycinamidine synthase